MGGGGGSSLLKLKSVEKHNGGASDRSSVNIMLCRVLLVYSYQIVFLDNVLFEANRQVREAS